MTNPYEQVGRERKAQAIARFLWRQIPREDRIRLELLPGIAAVPEDERDAFAYHAGQKPPSPETWARVVELVRENILDERRWRGIDASQPVGEQRVAS